MAIAVRGRGLLERCDPSGVVRIYSGGGHSKTSIVIAVPFDVTQYRRQLALHTFSMICTDLLLHFAFRCNILGALVRASL